MEQAIKEFLEAIRIYQENKQTGNISIEFNIVQGNLSKKYNIKTNRSELIAE